MTWNRAQYITDVKAAFDRAKDDSAALVSEGTVRQNFADDLADALEAAIETIDLTIPVGGIAVDPGTHANTAPLSINNAMS